MLKPILNKLRYYFTGKHECLFRKGDVMYLSKDPECYLCGKKLSDYEKPKTTKNRH